MTISHDLWDGHIECGKCQKIFISYDTDLVLMAPAKIVFYTTVSCHYCDHYDVVLLKSTKTEEKKCQYFKRFLNLLKGILK